MKIVLAVLFSMMAFTVGFIFPTYLTFQNVYADVCHFVSERITYPEKELSQWKRFCLKRSQLYKPWSDPMDLVRDIRQVLALLKISHLELYLPKEADEVWKGIVEKTGLRSQFIDGELFVLKIDPNSPAEKAGFKIGDVILAQNNEHPDPDSIYFDGGEIKTLQRGVTLLKPAVYRLNQDPVVSRIKPGWVLLSVPQFDDSFYKESRWIDELAKTVNPEDQILIDFRSNRGGTFFSALHFLSLFMCAETQVGRLVGANQKSAAVFPVTSDMSEQIQKMMMTGNLILQTPKSEVCLKNKLSLLVNSETASMAEIVSVVLKEQMQASVYGIRTAGETTIGFWYDFDEIYPGAQLTIPEARFISARNQDLEGKGLIPDKILYDKSEHWKQRQDSWIVQILQNESPQ